MPLPPDVVPLVREFASNSFRYLFRQVDNVADLLRWREPKIAHGIDFSQLVVQPETFIAPSFAQLESDILLRAPFQIRRHKDGSIEIFILIEHQSEPDELMLFRVVRYVVLIYERQATDWLQTHPNLRGFRFSPVLPIVFYSGRRSWDRLAPMAELVQQGKLFEKRLPTLEPEFINLATTGATDLQSKSGLFGWVLWLIQQKHRKEPAFRDVLRQVVTRVHNVREKNPGRWESLLWFLRAMVYHDREATEHDPLVEIIRSTVRQANQPEVDAMGKTFAQVLLEKGKQEGGIERSRDFFLLLLREKFKTVPESIIAEVQAATDIHQFDVWGSAFAKADTLADIPFKSCP
jgi:predicted transposase/invertase (TIGR01784 family)